MAIAIGDNFSYNGEKFLDGRDCFETLSDMKNFPEVSVPDGFKTYCKEDGREYRITKTNDLDPITGRWRVAEVEGIFGIKEVLNNDELDTINEDQIIFCDAGNSKKLYAYLPEYTREYVNINHTYTIEATISNAPDIEYMTTGDYVGFYKIPENAVLKDEDLYSVNINFNIPELGVFSEVQLINQSQNVIRVYDIEELRLGVLTGVGEIKTDEYEFKSIGQESLKISVLALDNKASGDYYFKVNFFKKAQTGTYRRKIISESVSKFTEDGGISLGNINNVVESSFAVGIGNSVLSPFSYAEGSFNSINGTGFSHAEGRYNQIIAGNGAHVEGKDNIAGHNQAHAEGYCTQALGNQSHAEGAKTIAHNHGEHACGVWNLSTKASDKAQATQFSIGIGTGESNRKNGIEVKKNGDVYVEGISGTLQNNISNRYTKSEVDQKIADIDINIEGADIDLSNYAKKTDLEPIQTGLQKVTDKVFNNYTGVYNVANDTKLCGEFKSFELIIRMGDLAPNTLNASRSELLKDNKGNPILFHNNSGTVVLETPLKKPEGGTQYPRSTVNATFKSGDIMHFVANISGNTLELYVNGLKGYTLNQEDWCIYDREQLLWGYTVLGRFDNSVKVLGFRTFNYVLTQSDVDMLYNQGRSGDVKLIDEYRNSFTGINTNKTYSDYTSENWITPNKVELTFLTKTRVIVLYAQNKQKGGIYIFRGKIQGTNGEFPSDFSASDASNYNYKILSKEYNKNTGEFFFKLLATGPTWFFHQLGNTSTNVGDTVILEFETQYINVLSEFTPENITSTGWINTGTQEGNIEFTDPKFITEAPIKERQWQISTATKPVPVAIGQKLYNTDNGLIFEAGAKPNTRQFTVSDWKQLN